MWSDILSQAELTYTERVIRALRSVGWATPLIRRFEEAGGPSVATMPLMFEIRFAYELHRAAAVAEYEYPAGVGDSSIDFRIRSSPEWLVELVSVRESEGLRRATHESGPFRTKLLSSRAADPAQSEEAEMIAALQRIAQKVYVDGAPTKFPEPNGRIHAILADMRGYLGEGGDEYDYQQMANGSRAIPASEGWRIHYWNDEPIRGLFERVDSHPLRAAPFAQARIHMLGFVAESEFEEGEITSKAFFQPNPNLLPKATDQEATYRSFVLAR